MSELLAQFEFDEAVERVYRLGEAAERAGNPQEAAVHFRVAADQHLGDAALRLAQALFTLGRTEEATHWCEAALADGFTEAAELMQSDVAARQRFLEHAARIMVGAPVSDWMPPAAPMQLLAPSAVRARTQALRALDQQYGGIACRTAVLEHLALVEPMVLAGDEAMWTAVAEVQELAGWTTFDSGLPGLALPHFERALTLARQAENEALIASVLTRAGRMFLHHNAPDDALRAFQLGSVAAHNSWADRRALDDPQRAIASLTTKVGTYDEGFVRARTIALAALARNHLAVGDLAKAGGFTQNALAEAAALRSTRFDDQLRWLAQEARRAGASALVEQISARFARCH